MRCRMGSRHSKRWLNQGAAATILPEFMTRRWFPICLHRASVAVLAGAVLFASLGLRMVPTTSPIGRAESDEWYPCKDHHCGCVSALMCQTHCCCFPASKLTDNRSECASAFPADKATQHDASESQPRSCCVAKRDASPPECSSDSNASSYSLVVQSPACSGESSKITASSQFWIAPVIANLEFTSAPGFKPWSVLKDSPSSADLTPDPPPPRPV